jgi:hypothetical protein
MSDLSNAILLDFIGWLADAGLQICELEPKHEEWVPIKENPQELIDWFCGFSLGEHEMLAKRLALHGWTMPAIADQGVKALRRQGVEGESSQRLNDPAARVPGEYHIGGE